MKLIDFDAQYADYAENWIRENARNYKNMDEMEAHLPEMFLRWLNTPADWLDGHTPGTYFSQYSDPAHLIEWLAAYEGQGVPVPDPLLERIVDLGESAIVPLMRVAGDGTLKNSLRITAFNLLIQLETKLPLTLCLDIVSERKEKDELADVAAEVLEAIGHDAIAPMLERLQSASNAALLTFLDLLCNFPGDERIYTYTLRQFLACPDQRALYASYLAKLGEASAIEPLTNALRLSDINYLDYIEIRNAIEMLGGEVTGSDPDFSGDPYYESLKKM